MKIKLLLVVGLFLAVIGLVWLFSPPPKSTAVRVAAIPPPVTIVRTVPVLALPNNAALDLRDTDNADEKIGRSLSLEPRHERGITT